jgi:hypothetical protein
MDVGRELLGVAPGVPLGVDDALSTRPFLVLDRGVTLLLKNALTGVARSSRELDRATRGLSAIRTLPSSGDETCAALSAIRGV